LSVQASTSNKRTGINIDINKPEHSIPEKTFAEARHEDIQHPSGLVPCQSPASPVASGPRSAVSSAASAKLNKSRGYSFVWPPIGKRREIFAQIPDPLKYFWQALLDDGAPIYSVIDNKREILVTIPDPLKYFW
jgi:hypothetical protein